MPRTPGEPKRRVNKNGTEVWSQLCDVGADPETGKRRIRRISATTKEECALLAAQLRLMVAQERERGGTVRNRSEVTFADAIARTLTRLDRTAGRPGHIKQSTAAQYRQRTRTMLETTVPHLLNRRVDTITTAQIQALYDELTGTVGASSLRVLHVILRKVFDEAVAAGDLTISPIQRLRLPRVTAEPHVVWTQKEARQIRAWLTQQLNADASATSILTARQRWHIPVVLILLATGMRIGEACALHWDDITLDDRPAIRIRRTASGDLAGGRIETAPKTAAAHRTIALAPELAAVLRQLRERQQERRERYGQFWQGGDDRMGHVLDAEDGRPLDPGNASDPVRRLCGYAGVTAIGPHGIRHTAGTQLAAAGVSPKAISVLLGHADIAITMRLYVHPDDAEIRSVSTVLDRLSAAPAPRKKAVRRAKKGT